MTHQSKVLIMSTPNRTEKPLLTPLGPEDEGVIPPPILHWGSSIGEYHLALERELRWLKWATISTFALLAVLMLFVEITASRVPALRAGGLIYWIEGLIGIATVPAVLALWAWGRLNQTLWFARASLWELFMLFRIDPNKAKCPECGLTSCAGSHPFQIPH